MPIPWYFFLEHMYQKVTWYYNFLFYHVKSAIVFQSYTSLYYTTAVHFVTCIFKKYCIFGSEPKSHYI